MTFRIASLALLLAAVALAPASVAGQRPGSAAVPGIGAALPGPGAVTGRPGGDVVPQPLPDWSRAGVMLGTPVTRADSLAPFSLVVQAQRTRRWEGAVIGAATFALATHLFLYSGGSTSLCDRERNQDAIRLRECNAIIAGSAVVGAGVGYMIGSRIRVGAAR